MKKRFLVTEEEKKHIQKLYTTQIVISEDLKSYIKSKGEDFLNFLNPKLLHIRLNVKLIINYE